MMSNFSICPYCGQPAGKSEIGMVLAIHPHHQAGTPFWARWYRQQREEGKRQTEVGDALLLMCEERAKSASAGLARMHELQRKKKEASNG
jgi:hypothetical protein